MTFFLVKNKEQLEFSEIENIKASPNLPDPKTVKEYMECVIEKKARKHLTY